VLITDKYVAACQPRTGSTLRRHGFVPVLGGLSSIEVGGKLYNGHIPLRSFPSEVTVGRTGIATVRDPFSWMASVYHWMRAVPRKSFEQHLLAWGQGSAEWSRVLYGWTHPWEVSPLLGSHAVANPGAPDWASQNEGFWTISTRWFHEGSALVLDASRQNEAWAELFPEHRDALIACGRKNGTPRPVVADLYTSEQEAWVRASDGVLMEKLGYDGLGDIALPHLVGSCPSL